MDLQLLFLVHLCVFLPITIYTIKFSLHFEEIHLNHIWDNSRVVIPKVGRHTHGALGCFPFNSHTLLNPSFG